MKKVQTCFIHITRFNSEGRITVVLIESLIIKSSINTYKAANAICATYLICATHFREWRMFVQSTLSFVIGHVSQFRLSQSHGRDRLLESAQFDSVTISCTVDSGHWLFFFLLFLFEMQNNSSQPKNEKSTACKTRPTLVEKMAMLEEIYAGVSHGVFLFLQLIPVQSVNQSINQSINQSNDQSINRSIELSLTEKCCEKFY